MALRMKNLKYGSVCSGVEAATVAWHDLGWKPQWFSEVDNFPSAVLEHHYPDVPNYGDMTKFKEWPKNESIDLLVGGTPCQSFSVAGLRKGLEDPRGNLMLTYLSMAEQLKPKWLVWENVPGVLSSNGGRDFGTFITALGKIGYGFSWRVLDAQFFGVPQRRRRVFVVGCFGDWRSAASVLFESESLSGHPAPSRKKGKRVAPTVTVGAPFSRTGNSRVECDALVFGAQNSASQGDGVSADISPTLDTSKTPAVTYAMPGNWIGRKPENGGNQVEPFVDLSPCQTATDVHAVSFATRSMALTVGEEISSTLCASDYKEPQAVVYEHHWPDSRVKELSEVCSTITAKYGTGGGNTPIVANSRLKQWPAEVASTLDANYGDKMGLENQHINAGASLFVPGKNEITLNSNERVNTVRRLLPKECERLQGFPDDYTQISWRNKKPEDCPNGHRYKAMGNSMAVPVMKWIGERIQQVENG